MNNRRRMLGAAAVALAALATLASGCDLVRADRSSQASFTLDREQVAAGQFVELRFDKLADEDGRRFWVALVPEDSRGSDEIARTPVGAGVRSLRLPTSAIGNYEVRVLTEEHDGPNVVVARRKLKVVP